MVILGILLVLAGAGLLVAEAHLPTFGLLGVAGLVSLVAGGAIAVDASGGGPVLAAVVAMVLLFVDGALWSARPCMDEPDGLHVGDPVVVEQVRGLTLSVRRAEDWELET